MELQGIEQLSEISLRHPVFLDAAGEGGTEDKHSLSTPVNLKQTFLLGKHVMALCNSLFARVVVYNR